MGWFRRWWWWFQRPELSLRRVIFMDEVGCKECSRCESLVREVAVLRAEREALLARLESAKRELMT